VKGFSCGASLMAAFCFAGTPVFAQLRKGDLSTDLSGSVSTGYNADYGNTVISDHSWTASGIANLTGYYYDPNFLSFDIQPFYNTSRLNSDYQSIVDASGINASASIFGGSNFPGSISYSKIFSSSGSFGVPEVANFTTHGNSDSLTIGWGVHVPDYPQLNVSYLQGTSDSSIYGLTSDIGTSYHGFNANSVYRIWGFTLTAGFHYIDTHLTLPEAIGGGAVETSDSSNKSYSAGIGHSLPWRGSFSAGATRSDVDSTYTGGNYGATLDTLSAGVSFNPLDQFHLGANAQYTDNLLGTLYQGVIGSGGILPASTPTPESSHALDATGYATYEVPAAHLTFTGTDEHRDQRIAGSSLSSDAYTGTGTYTNTVYGGNLTATGGVNHTSVSPSNQSRLGFIGIVNYIRPVGRWTVAGSVNYAQNSETLLITYTTDSYGYSGSVSRKFHQRYNWSLIASGTRSSLAQERGSTSFNQTYSTALSLRKIFGSASYTKSSGEAVLTSTGLIAGSILLTAVVPTAVVAYGGTAYSGSLAATPIRGLTISASYSRSASNTLSGDVASRNNTSQLYARVQYLIRRIYFQAGYLRLTQGFTASGIAPVSLSSLYVGLSRWFNFF